MGVPEPIAIEEIRAARERIADAAIRTPLVRLHVEDAPAEIHLKLENLQPIGSFKLRGAGNAMALAGRAALARGVCTASAGNMAQGVAWNARRLGVSCQVVVPEQAPRAKIEAIERLGGRIVRLPFDAWWRVIVEHEGPGLEGRFIHPVSDRGVIAGNGTIGLEILEDLPDVDAVVVPYGGGGLSCGIASAVKALRPAVKVFAAEVATAAPLAASLAAGAPRQIDYTPSFVDGIGAKGVLAEMWPLSVRLLDGSLVASVAEVAEAVRLLATRGRVVAEGAGATPVAVALKGLAGRGKVACVVSGGNIDPSTLARILIGEVP
jgi:threonine dehydratase